MEYIKKQPEYVAVQYLGKDWDNLEKKLFAEIKGNIRTAADGKVSFETGEGTYPLEKGDWLYKGKNVDHSDWHIASPEEFELQYEIKK